MCFIFLIYFSKEISGERGIIHTLSGTHFFVVYFTSFGYILQRLLEERISIVVDKSETGKSPDFVIRIIKFIL